MRTLCDVREKKYTFLLNY